ncbi:hypothetical protein Q3C77_11140 [Enterococcus faecium]|nr:hypothetical protein [Enterococcus faecium]MDQ8507278.1 hypothetical protein [Enterococcus faecium]
MDKKATMKRIIELTHSENWQEDKEIVAVGAELNLYVNGTQEDLVRFMFWMNN